MRASPKVTPFATTQLPSKAAAPGRLLLVGPGPRFNEMSLALRGFRAWPCRRHEPDVSLSGIWPAPPRSRRGSKSGCFPSSVRLGNFPVRSRGPRSSLKRRVQPPRDRRIGRTLLVSRRFPRRSSADCHILTPILWEKTVGDGVTNSVNRGSPWPSAAETPPHVARTWR